MKKLALTLACAMCIHVFAFLGKHLQFVGQLCLVGQQFLGGFDFLFPQQIALPPITVEFAEILAQQVVAAPSAFAAVASAQQGTVMVIASHNAAHLFIGAVQPAAAARTANGRRCRCLLPALRHRLVFCLIFLLHFGRKFFYLREKISQFQLGKLRRYTIQSYKLFAGLVPNCHMLDAGTVLDLVAHPLQLADKIVKVGAFSKRHFHIGFDHTAQCRLALVAVAPFSVGDAAPVRFYD